MSRSRSLNAPSATPEVEGPGSGALSQDISLSNADAQEALKKVQGGGYYTVKPGDTLSGIARATYGNAALWDEIMAENPSKVKRGGDLIYVGSVLKLPTLDDGMGDAGDAGDAGGAQVAIGPEVKTTDFGVFEVYPDDFVGPLPPTRDAVQVVRAATFRQYEAEATSETINLDIDALEENVCFGATVVTIAGETVAVTSKAEAQHAQRILKNIREVYGIKVDSAAGVDALKARYTKVPQAERDKLKTKEWEYKELVAVENALAHFAPILGANRAGSSRSGADQEVTSVSKVDQSIDFNSSTGVLDTTTLGEYFQGSKNFSMFTAGTDNAGVFADNNKELEGTAVHELAHGLLRHEEGNFVAAMDYWTDKYTPSGRVGAEAPPTQYGQTNAGEDLSETVMFYFVEPGTLLSTCPKRHAWIEAVVAGWSKKTP